MKLSEVLIKPVLTEKANGQQDKLRRYAFKVPPALRRVVRFNGF